MSDEIESYEIEISRLNKLLCDRQEEYMNLTRLYHEEKSINDRNNVVQQQLVGKLQTEYDALLEKYSLLKDDLHNKVAKEKTLLQDKIELQKGEIIGLKNEVLRLGQIKERLEEDILRLEKAVEQKRLQMDEALAREKAEKESLREKMKKMGDDFTYAKIEQEKLAAIMDQQKQHSGRKIEELKQQLLEQQKKFDQALDS